LKAALLLCDQPILIWHEILQNTHVKYLVLQSICSERIKKKSPVHCGFSSSIPESCGGGSGSGSDSDINAVV
jgi:hypothetical protein